MKYVQKVLMVWCVLCVLGGVSIAPRATQAASLDDMMATLQSLQLQLMSLQQKGLVLGASTTVIDMNTAVTPGIINLRTNFDPAVYEFENTGAQIFVATNGNDSNAGTLSSPLATIQAAFNKAKPGDTVLVRGGTYQQVGYTNTVRKLTYTLITNKSGEVGKPIIISNYNNEEVILDGSKPLSFIPCAQDADCASLPNASSLFVATLPASFTLANSILYEGDRLIPVTRTVAPQDSFLYDVVKNAPVVSSAYTYTDTTMRNPELFTATDPAFYTGAQLWINSCNNNFLQKDITAYDPAQAQITYSTLGCPNYLTPNKDRFVIANLPSTVRAGEMYFLRTKNKVVVWPLSAQSIADNKVTLSQISGGVYMSKASNITIKGLHFARFGAEAIAKFSNVEGPTSNIILYKNSFDAIGGRSIFLYDITDARLTKNTVTNSGGGVFLASSRRGIVSNNLVSNVRLTGITSYTNIDSWFVGNVVRDSGGHHANAYTLGYLNNNGLLIESNYSRHANISLTLEQSRDMVYYRNQFYSDSETWPFAGWGGKLADGSSPRNIYLVENTIVREGSTKPAVTISSDYTNVQYMNNVLSNVDKSFAVNPTLPNPIETPLSKAVPFSASVVVPPPPTPTPVPLPVVSVTATPVSVVSGASVTLAWNSTNATACTASGDWTGAKQITGTQSISALTAGTKTFTLVCTGAGGSASAVATVTVTTSPVIVAAPTLTFTASPIAVTTGNAAMLTWTSTDAASCTASGAWTDTKVVSGSQSTGVLTAGVKVYMLTCTGTGGSVSKSVAITVTDVVVPPVVISTSTPTPVPTPVAMRVETISNLNVRTAPNGTKLGMQSLGAQGTMATTTIATTGGYDWVYVNFDSAPDGYVVKSYLKDLTVNTTTSLEQTIKYLQSELARLQKLLRELQGR